MKLLKPDDMTIVRRMSAVNYILLLINTLIVIGIFWFVTQYPAITTLQVEEIVPHTTDELEDLIYISNKFGDAHNYNRSTYNCINFTNEMYDIATSLGYNVMYMQGCPLKTDKDNTCHVWLRWYVDIEPQHGNIAFDYSEKYPVQKIKRVNCDNCFIEMPYEVR